MTLSEFKVWFEGVYEVYSGAVNPYAVMLLDKIKEKLASVEDGSANEMKEITCPCCDALFKIMMPIVYKAHPGDSVPRPVAMPETVQETHDTLARQYHNAAINDLITTKEPL